MELIERILSEENINEAIGISSTGYAGALLSTVILNAVQQLTHSLRMKEAKHEELDTYMASGTDRLTE
ncbi:MAG: hypothetical protein IKF00_11890 [Solobacterium sp.]|nr:hypothetical protein [Solobacterium sp.]